MMINELNAINDIRLCLEFQMRALKDISQLRREKKTLCRRIKYDNSDRIFVTKNEKRDIEIVKKLIEKYKSKVKVYEKWEESILNIDIFNEEERKFVLEKFEGFKITIEDGLEESINAYEIISLLSSLRFFE